MTTNVCTWCQMQPDTDDPPHKRCTRCKAVYYCARECQAKDWKHHKKECKEIAEGARSEPSPRTTILGIPSPNEEDAADNPTTEMLYYLKIFTQKPFEDKEVNMENILSQPPDVTMMGPFAHPDMPGMVIRLRLIEEQAWQGFKMFENMEIPMHRLTMLRTALPGGTELVFQLKRLKNPNSEVMAFLNSERTTKPLIYTTIVLNFNKKQSNEENAEYWTPDDIDAVFLTKGAAIQRVENLVQQWKRDNPQARAYTAQNGEFGVLEGPGPSGSKSVTIFSHNGDLDLGQFGCRAHIHVEHSGGYCSHHAFY